MLVYAIATESLGSVASKAVIALVLFLLAAAGGAVMSLQYKWKQRLLPKWLVLVYATAAVAGFLVLALAAFAG